MKQKILSMLLLALVVLSVGALGYQQSECYSPEIPTIDVVFLLDSTGSMGDEIRQVKTHIKKIVREVEEGYPKPDLKVGIVTYRDHKPEEREYVYRTFDLTNNIEKALDDLESIRASGGGDYPEAVADGMHVAIHKMDWRKDAKKIIFLIGDAAPHGIESNSFSQGCPSGYDYKDEITNALKEDIVIYTISGSGMGHKGIDIWKEIAKRTGGDYHKLTYQQVDVDQYYENEGLPEAYATEAKTDGDYDRRSNQITVNSLGDFSKQALIVEAEEMGVVYGETPKEDDWFSKIISKFFR